MCGSERPFTQLMKMQSTDTQQIRDRNEKNAQTRGNKIGWVWNCFTFALATHTAGPRPGTRTQIKSNRQLFSCLLSVWLICVCMWARAALMEGRLSQKNFAMWPKATSEYKKKRAALGLWLLRVAPQFISLAAHCGEWCLLDSSCLRATERLRCYSERSSSIVAFIGMR